MDATMNEFRTLGDEQRYSRMLWAGEQRPVEFDAFGMVLGIFVTGVQFSILFERRAVKEREAKRLHRQQRRDDDRVRKIVMRVRWYETHEKMERPVAKEAAARDLGISTQDVGDALIDANERWLFE